MRIVVATGNSSFDSKPRLQCHIPRVAGVDGRRPRKDGIVSKGAELYDLLAVPGFDDLREIGSH